MRHDTLMPTLLLAFLATACGAETVRTDGGPDSGAAPDGGETPDAGTDASVEPPLDAGALLDRSVTA